MEISTSVPSGSSGAVNSTRLPGNTLVVSLRAACAIDPTSYLLILGTDHAKVLSSIASNHGGCLCDGCQDAADVGEGLDHTGHGRISVSFVFQGHMVGVLHG